ncbi:hypothetical protein DPMN_104996 [Dreissena polymorpha]|uniref:Uncharacterized protein n=1 Tax=Dreissena polymorpha TaxID=45954 RepID=A0A9D4K1J1_DREPO|nr:hypothetical protein DPMN_104996 [Dreissena polymorpha]
MEILERKSQLQALEIQLLQQELTDLREVTRNLQNSLTHRDDTHSAIVDQPKDISDHAHTEHNWKYQVLKALKYEKMARFSMEERINSLVNLLEQNNQDMVNLLEQNNQGNVKMFAEMKAGLS